MTDFLIAQYEFNDDESVREEKPELRITEVPEKTSLREIKETLKQVGYNYKWGLYTLVPVQDWIEAGSEPNVWVDSTQREFQLDVIVSVSYEDLLDKVNDEKRITLRLPVGLHVALSEAAGEMTLNAYCIKVLADKVNYSKKLEEFEAQRRKPGRPKKVQDSE